MEQVPTSIQPPLHEWAIILNKFVDTSASDEVKLKCLQKLVKSWDKILGHSSSKRFVEAVIPPLATELEQSEPNFIEQTHRHLCRKIIIEIFRRLASHPSTNKNVVILEPPQVSRILSSIFKSVVDVDNEVNVLCSLRVIFALHKYHKPGGLIEETKNFLRLVQAAFLNLHGKLEEVFSHKTSIEPNELVGQGGHLQLLNKVFAVTPIHTKNLTLIPKGTNSLKVLHELPIVTLILHQVYKELVQTEMDQLIPFIISTVSLHPTEVPTNRKVFLEFLAVQIKILSMLGYIIKLPAFQNPVVEHGELITSGFINLLKWCPSDAVSLRREALTVAGVLIKTQVGFKFINHVSEFFDIDLILGRGWTARRDETVRSLAFKLVAELMGTLSQCMSVADLIRAMHFSVSQLLDDSNTIGIQTMFVRLLFPLVETMYKKLAGDEMRGGRDILFQLLEVLLCKLKMVSARSSEFSATEAQAFLKEVFSNFKRISWLIQGRNLEASQPQIALKVFSAGDADIYVNLLNWGLKAMGVFSDSKEKVSLMEAKEVWMDFGYIFSSLNVYTFRQVCSASVETIMEALGENTSVQQLIRNFLAQVDTSPVFGRILLEYLLKNIELLGEKVKKRSEIFLRLFRAIFATLKLFPAENEAMLKPFFAKIVSKAMALGKSSKEPLNYFKLLLDLFIVTNGGNYELLHQEFLPLLPNLARDLQRLRNGSPPKEVNELVINLCLSLPARVCNLLPQMSVLMDSVVAALSEPSSPSLVIFGLRYLELLVDNVAADSLLERLQPVQTELMEALWKILRNSDPSSLLSISAFRILGKFGGINRKGLIVPQKLKCHPITGEGQSVQLQFMDDHPLSVNLPLENIVQVAVKTLHPNNSSDAHYKNQALEILRGVLLSAFPKQDIKALASSLREKIANPALIGAQATMIQSKCNFVFEKALSGWMNAATVKEIRKDVFLSLTPILRQIAVIILAEEMGHITPNSNGIETYAVFDALFNAFASEEKGLRRVALYSLSVILNGMIHLMSSKEKVFTLPLMGYIIDKMCGLCQDSSWRGKMGGLEVISFFLENAPIGWIYANQVLILKALLFLLKDLSGQVYGGVAELAKENVAKLIQVVSNNSEERLQEMKVMSVADISRELLKRLTSPASVLREECKRGLELLAKLNGQTVSQLLAPQMAVISGLIPSKTLLRNHSIPQQLGILDGWIFCLSSNPKCFSLKWTIAEHQSFIVELLVLGETNEERLRRSPSYRLCSSPNFVLLQQGILQILSTLTDLPTAQSHKIISIFFLHLGSSHSELQEVAFQSFKKLMTSTPVPAELQMKTVETVLSQMQFPTVNISTISHFSYLYQLFSNAVPLRIWNPFCQLLHKFLELVVNNARRNPNSFGVHKLDLCVKILECFLLLNDVATQFIPVLIKLCVEAEKALFLGEGNPMRPPLFKFLLKHSPAQYICFLLPPATSAPQERSRFFLHLIQTEEAQPLRLYLLANPRELLKFINPEENEHSRFVAVKALIILNSFDEQYVYTPDGEKVVDAFELLWMDNRYQVPKNHSHSLKLPIELRTQRWEEGTMVVKHLLRLRNHGPKKYEYGLLFQLLAALCWIPTKQDDFAFLKDFFEKEVSTFDSFWKRDAALHFLNKIYNNWDLEEELKAKIIQFVLIPGFTRSFEENKEDELINGDKPPVGNIADLLIINMLPIRSGVGDELIIAMLQFFSLLVDRAPNLISQPCLKKLEIFAWGFVNLETGEVDPCVKYRAHLLLSHLCAKFTANKQSVLKMFYNLLSSSPEMTEEAMVIANEALDIFIPAILKMEDGFKILFGCTTKMLQGEESGTLNQLVHVLRLIVRHWKVFYNGRQLLIGHGKLMEIITRLGLSGSELCHKMVALDLAQVILNWELLTMENVGKKESEEENRLLHPAPIRTLLRFVLQMSCQENTEKRSKVLLNLMLKPDIWLSHLNHLDYGWMKKVLIVFPNFSTIICSCLELLTFVIGMMSNEAVLRTMGVLREEIIFCIATKSQEKCIQVILHKLISQLMHLFPVAEISSDLKQIYNSVFEIISKGMESSEIGAHQDDLVAALLMLQAACGSNPGFIDPFMIRIMGILEKLSRIPHGENQAVPAELLVFIINLVNTKLPVMREEMRTTWVEIVLVNFIDNSKQVKILELILEMVEEKPGEGLLSLKEMEILMVKLMKNIETRFAKEEKVVKKFLNLVLTVYEAETCVKFEDTDLRALLEPAFFRGLCHPQPEMRDKFSQVFDGSIKKQVFERLFYIVSHQNWGAMGAQYWITQCLQLLFGTVVPSNLKIIPKIEEVEPFVKKEEPSPPSSQQELDKLLNCLANTDDSDEKAVADAISKLECAFIKEGLAEAEHPNWNLMLENCQEKSRLSNVLDIVLTPTIELCHLEAELAESLWISVLPKLWKALSLRQQQILGNEIPIFFMSGIHLQQQHCSPSALATFFEAVSRFEPPIPIQPSLLFHLGKTHNLWHSSVLLLEQLLGNFERIPSELRDSLSELYSELGELDLCAGLWQRSALLPETGAAIALEQEGNFSKAQEMFELAMNKMGSEGASNNSALIGEARFLEEHWLKCSKELNEWDAVQEYTAVGGAGANPMLHLEALWKKADWAAAQKALLIIQEQDGCPKGEKWKLELIQGYISLFSGGGGDVQRFADKAHHLCVQEWKGLSKFVGGGQVRVLQGVQQVVELREAACLHQSLLANRFGEVERVVKAWYKRLPTISDDLSHWFDILCWRALNYQHIENQSSQELTAEGGDSADRKLFGVHASVQAICQFGKVARKHGHAEVALEALEKVYELPKVPVNDCFQKLKQQFKCYLQKGRFQDAMEIMEESNLEYFGKETISEYLALKGQLLVKMGEDEEANKAFSASCHLVPETLGKNWALWGEYLENCSISQGKPELGISAITAFLRACQSFGQVEGKARKYIAKVLWLLGSCTDENGTDSVLEWCEQIPSIQWLIWIPQLLTMLVEKDGKVVSNILNRVGSAFPQALYFPLRTLYLTLKVEQTEKLNKEFVELLGHPSGAAQQIPTIKATPSMWRCSKVMQAQRMNHPVLLSVLEGIAEELSFFRETWQEEQLKQLKTALASCYRIAFENRDFILVTSLTPEIAGRINKVGLGFQFTQFPQDPWFGWMKAEFEKDFGHRASPQELLDVIQKLLKWIEIFEGNVKALPSLVLCDERSKLLLSFSMDIADVKLPGEFLIPKTPHYSVRIARFEAKLDVVVKPDSSGKRLTIRAHNGKVYPYLVANNSEPSEWEGERSEERVLQLLRILNNYLGKQKETAKRSTRFMVPKLVAVSPQLRLAEDYPASLSLLEMFKLACSKQGFEVDSLVLSYYQKLGDIQGKGEQLTHGALRDIYQGIQQGLVSVDVLKDWATQNCVSASDYWMFRKTFTTQMCLNILAEYAFQLTSLKPEGMNIHPDTGLVNISYFKFDTDASQLPVPFRLTSNLYEFMTANGVTGPLTFGLQALAKCLTHPNYKLEAILRPILKDEMLANLKRNEGKNCLGWETPMETSDPETVTDLVNNAVSAIMTRLSGITVGKVNELIAAASSVDNLCRTDPSSYPWL